MKTVRVTIDANSNGGRIDPARVDASTEHDIARQMVEDETEALLDAAKFARRASRSSEQSPRSGT